MSCQYWSSSSGTRPSSRSQRTCRVVMSSISRARSSASASAAAGRLRDQRRAAAVAASSASAHFRISCASSIRAFEPAERLRQIERSRRGLAGRGFGEGNLVLVDVADRHDARQDRGVAFEHVEENVARQPAGAPRRQIERRRGERQRIAAGLEAEAKPAVINASISVGRNGADAGMVKTRGDGGHGARIVSSPAHAGDADLRSRADQRCGG